jgi:hypothetical protein
MAKNTRNPFFPQEKYSLYSKGYKYIQRLPLQKEPQEEQSWWIDIEQTTPGRTEASNTTRDQLSGQKNTRNPSCSEAPSFDSLNGQMINIEELHHFKFNYKISSTFLLLELCPMN